MMSLPQKDYRAILDFLHEINTIQTTDAFLQKVITGLSTIVAGDLVSCFESGPTEEDLVVCFSDPQYLKYFPAWMRSCNDLPGWGLVLQSGDRSWHSVSDYLSETAYHRTALYNEVGRHVKIEDNLGTLSVISANIVVAFSINRDRRSFKENDRRKLNLLQPHLIQAWCNNKRVTNLHDQINGYAQTLEARAEGIVILDGKRKVRHITTRALRSTEKYFGALTGSDHLPKRLHDWVCRHGRPQYGLETAPRRPLIIEHAEGSELTVSCVPCRDGVSLILQERTLACDLTALGLTRRESDVLLWVTRGKSNEEIGLILGMRLGTVKKHMEHIFQKLGVESRTAAAAKALSEAAA